MVTNTSSTGGTAPNSVPVPPRSPPDTPPSSAIAAATTTTTTTTTTARAAEERAGTGTNATRAAAINISSSGAAVAAQAQEQEDTPMTDVSADLNVINDTRTDANAEVPAAKGGRESGAEAERMPPVAHASIPYSEEFTNALMRTILEPSDRSSTPNSVSGEEEREEGSEEQSRSQRAGTRILSASADPSAGTSSSRSGSSSGGGGGRRARESERTIHIQAIDQANLPRVQASELPLALNDVRRVYKTMIPGLKLTHPGGWIEGGAGAGPIIATSLSSTFSSSRSGNGTRGGGSNSNSNNSSGGGGGGGGRGGINTISSPSTREYVQMHNLRTPRLLHAHVERETSRQMEELRRRMRARHEAIEKNERIDHEIEQLVAMREMERRVEEKMRKKAASSSSNTATIPVTTTTTTTSSSS